MISQVKWGIALIVCGLVLIAAVDNTVIRLVYGVPLVVFGGALVYFRSREEVIEEIK